MKASLIAIIAALGLIPASATAASFTIDFSLNGGQNFTGTFEAPELGGAVTNFTATIDGVVFDVQDNGFGFQYVPLINDFDITSSFTNSNMSAICPIIGTCDLTIFPDPDPLVPGDYSAVAADFSNFDDGTKYEIIADQPPTIPIPAGLPLLVTGLAAIGLVRRRRTATDH